MSVRRGLGFAMGSVLLVSGAQLGMRWGMARLPAPDLWLQACIDGVMPVGALAWVAGAICAYVLSMGCWLMALRDVPLGRAYSLLSISYALVYLAAASIAAFNEHFSVFKTLGVTLVILGVLTINSKRTPRIKS